MIVERTIKLANDKELCKVVAKTTECLIAATTLMVFSLLIGKVAIFQILAACALIVAVKNSLKLWYVFAPSFREVLSMFVGRDFNEEYIHTIVKIK